MNGKPLREVVSGPVQILMIHTNERWNINKGSKGQACTGTLNHDKASDTMDKQTHQFSRKDWLCKSLVLPMLLYGCDSCGTLTADLEKRIQAMENECYRRLVGISYTENHTNEYVWRQVNFLVGREERLLSTVGRRKLSWFGHVCRHDSMPKQ